MARFTNQWVLVSDEGEEDGNLTLPPDLRQHFGKMALIEYYRKPDENSTPTTRWRDRVVKLEEVVPLGTSKAEKGQFMYRITLLEE